MDTLERIALLTARKVAHMGVLWAQTVDCLGKLVAYLIPCIVVLLMVRRFLPVTQVVFRKLLHVVAFSCVTVMVCVASSWQAAALASCMVAIAVYPVLAFLEERPWFSSFFVQKSPGETKRSLLMLFFMFAVLVAVAWGCFGRRELAAASILMWGVGDGVAALVGTAFGRHKVSWGFAGGQKSWEGTSAMAASSFACGWAVFVWGGYAPLHAASLAAVAAVVGAMVELLTSSEYDTLSVPSAILAVLLVLVVLS